MAEIPGTMKDVMAFFGMPVSEFSKEWKELSDQDKLDLKNGVGKDGTGPLTY